MICTINLDILSTWENATGQTTSPNRTRPPN
jgi:hypothetical protein